MKHHRRLCRVVFMLATSALAVAQCPDFTADAVLGQADFLGSAPNQPSGNVSAAGLALVHASAVAVGPTGRVYVSDAGNNRVLSWPSSAGLSNGQLADQVFGQPDFVSDAPNYDGVSPRSFFLPQGVCVDGHGNVWICDAFNHRVLKFNNPQIDATPFDADLVIGQLDLSSSAPNLGPDEGGNHGAHANSLLFPGRVIVRGAHVYVADSGNSRVLHYTNPSANSPSADAVFGQYGDLTCRAENNDGACNFTDNATAHNLKNPIGLAVDGAGRLYVADWPNNRVLRYDAPQTSQAADAVLGQFDFFGSGTNSGGPTVGMSAPLDLAIDRMGRVLVADSGNNRVLIFSTPLTQAQPACVYGQLGDLSGIDPNHGQMFQADADGLFAPSGLAAIGDAHWIVDSGNHRVLSMDRRAPAAHPGPAIPKTPISARRIDP